MANSGVAIMGSASAKGENRAIEAIREALTSPLLNNNNINGATNILLNITSGKEEVTMSEIGQINDFVQECAGLSANIIWGNGNDDTLNEELTVTVIATGFESSAELLSERPSAEMRAQPEDLDIPTHIRRNTRFAELQSIPPPAAERSVVDRLPVAGPVRPQPQSQPIRELRSVAESDLARQLEDEEYDVPTFLRRPDR